MSNTEDVFTSIYKTNAFYDSGCGIDNESISGAGSSLQSTEIISKELPRLINNLHIGSLLDLCCGDCGWITKLDLNVQYVGVDIVQELIKINRMKYKYRQFMYMDLLSSDLPRWYLEQKMDLILCRDCLVHFSYGEATLAIQNICRSNSKYLLTTTFCKHNNDQDIAIGSWHTVNLELPPFNLPPPLLIINENCQEHHPNFLDKSLGLWRIEDLV